MKKLLNPKILLAIGIIDFILVFALVRIFPELQSSVLTHILALPAYLILLYAAFTRFISPLFKKK
jgi:hypothetical protein